ncbi:MAG: WD40/YVTN/BNR-like repeat-containing protein, partial [Terriglobales bacterium]
MRPPLRLLLAGSLLAMTLPAQNVTELKNLKFRSLGPMAGGRVDAVAGIPGRPNVYLFGAAAGGVFRTEDGGLTWKATFEHEAVASIGALAVAPSDPNVVWVGTGEANARGDVSYGNGVYRSTDGGKTWTHLGLDDTQTISQIAVDPRNPDVALVAAVGHIFGPNAERGVFRTTDGGKTWQKVLYKDDNTGASSVALDPQNPRIVYAGLWSVRRSPWNLTDGGSTGGLYRSTDGGSTWKELEGHGLPSGLLGKIGVTVAPSDSNRVYAMIETEKGLLWRSDDAGETWKMINASHAIDQRPWYYTYVIVDPRNPDVLYCPSVPLMKSIDGGLHFSAMDQRHGDNH